ncbi:MAG TPA: double zinc ribbon domain-containing protein, partial [bacterium]|nr:double zinc ribbon domain-containing protein [bacterium]
MKKVIDFLYAKIVDFLFPQFCITCDLVLDSLKEIALCENCANKILSIPRQNHICFRCGKILTSPNFELLEKMKIQNLKMFCADCRYYKKYFLSSRHIYVYRDFIKKIILDYKYHNIKDYGILISSKFIEYLKTPETDYSKIKFDYIINIPMHINKINQGRFDHINFICETLSEELKIPYINNVLQKNVDTHQQAGLPRKERLKNIKKSFVVNSEVNIDFNNKNL